MQWNIILVFQITKNCRFENQTRKLTNLVDQKIFSPVSLFLLYL